MKRAFDLLGDPIPDGRGEPGRTGHIATAENVKRVRVLLVSGMTKPAVAEELGISLPTLNKHYFENGRVSYAQARATAIAETRSQALLLLQKQAAKGNVPAIKAVAAAAERAAVEMMDAAASRKPAADAPRRAPTPRPEGKKEADRHAAMEAEADLARRYGKLDLH